MQIIVVSHLQYIDHHLYCVKKKTIKIFSVEAFII